MKKWIMALIATAAITTQAGGIAWSIPGHGMHDYDLDPSFILPDCTVYLALTDAVDTIGAALADGTINASMDGILHAIPYNDYVDGATYYTDHSCL